MYEYSARCVKVVDGDTYDFEVDLGFRIVHTIRVRLKTVDTPELRSQNEAEREHAKEAKALCVVLLLDSCDTITLRTEKDKIGIYGRYTATVTLEDGHDLGAVLVEKGMEKKAEYPENPSS